MKEKIKRKIKRTVTYIEYKNGTKRLEYDLPNEVKRWIAQSYLDELMAKDRGGR